MELYHITCKEYPIGQVPLFEGESFYHISTQLDDRSWVNEFLDIKKSSEKPSRKKAFFACDSIANCKALKNTVAKPFCSPRIYKVKMTNPSKTPIALVNHLFKLGEGHIKNTEVADEYWNPTEIWKFYEYLSEQMEIVEEILNDDLTPMGQILFWAADNTYLLADTELANEKFNK